MFAKLVRRVSLFLQVLAGVILMAMMGLACADVAAGALNASILGSAELISLMAALLVAFVLPLAHRNEAHVGIDLVYRRLGPRGRRINDALVGLATAAFFAVTCWQCYAYAEELRRSGEVSSTLQLPTYGILYAISFACLVVFLMAVLQLARIPGRK
ncbi:MAG: TRAP transporter small permease [Desulfohalobiaceae bacterium]|nr:TRAP transporter small permease [Desulfohalobiaceae bacterium]